MLPPAALLEHCHADYGDRELGTVILALAGVVRCERAGKDAIKEWAENYVDQK